MRRVDELTLTEKIGQMVMAGFDGHQPTDGILRLIRENRLGGVIYFSRNYASPRQLHQLSQRLLEAAREVSDIPLFIAGDQEGGMVARFTAGITLPPGNMAIGATRSEVAACESARICGKELRLLGVNMNLAPCLDINNNPRNPVIGVRSYGESPDLVAALGAAAIRGFQEEGVVSTVKHFPGHGDTVVDSHLGLPVIEHDQERIHAVELVPFRRAVMQGVDAVMTAHVVFPALDGSGLPSTLSPAVIDGLLRGEMLYDGLVLTDCLEMDAIAQYYGVERAAVMAVEAGVDILLVSHRLDRQLSVLRTLEEAVQNGRISEERINRSVERILRVKQRRLEGCSMLPFEEVEPRLMLPTNQRFVESISQSSITLVKDERNHLPLDRQKYTCVIWPRVSVASAVDEIYEQQETLGFCLAADCNNLYERVVDTDPTDEAIVQIVEECGRCEQVVAATYNTALFPQQAKMIRALHERYRDKLIVVAVRNPFDLLDFPDVSTYLACYESRPQAMRAAADVLTGKRTASGRLPVTLSEAHPFVL